MLLSSFYFHASMLLPKRAWDVFSIFYLKETWHRVDVPASEGVLLFPTFLMAPRSRSSSESSHDSESPRKRAPSYSDAEGEIDAPGSPVLNGLYSPSELARVTPGCAHIEVLLGSTKLVHNYEKAVRWATRSRNNSRPPRKRRKACPHHSFTLNDSSSYVYKYHI